MLTLKAAFIMCIFQVEKNHALHNISSSTRYIFNLPVLKREKLDLVIDSNGQLKGNENDVENPHTTYRSPRQYHITTYERHKKELKKNG